MHLFMYSIPFFDHTNIFDRFSTYYGNDDDKKEAWGHGDRTGARDMSVSSLRCVFSCILLPFLTTLITSIGFLPTTAMTMTTGGLGSRRQGKGLRHVCLEPYMRLFIFIITFLFSTILIISIVYLHTTATTTTTRSVGITETGQGLFFSVYIYFFGK